MQAVPGLVMMGDEAAMLVGSDEVVREVHAAMVAWDGYPEPTARTADEAQVHARSSASDALGCIPRDSSAGGLSRIAELHRASNLTPEQRELLALAATEVRLAKRAHLIQQERLMKERQARRAGARTAPRRGARARARLLTAHHARAALRRRRWPMASQRWRGRSARRSARRGRCVTPRLQRWCSARFGRLGARRARAGLGAEHARVWWCPVTPRVARVRDALGARGAPG